MQKNGLISSSKPIKTYSKPRLGLGCCLHLNHAVKAMTDCLPMNYSTPMHYSYRLLLVITLATAVGCGASSPMPMQGEAALLNVPPAVAPTGTARSSIVPSTYTSLTTYLSFCLCSSNTICSSLCSCAYSCACSCLFTGIKRGTSTIATPPAANQEGSRNIVPAGPNRGNERRAENEEKGRRNGTLHQVEEVDAHRALLSTPEGDNDGINQPNKERRQGQAQE